MELQRDLNQTPDLPPPMQAVQPGGGGAPPGAMPPPGDQPYHPPATTGGGGPPAGMAPGQHPVRLIMPFPQEFSRLQALLFTFLGIVGFLMMIPHFFMILIFAIAWYFVNIIAFFAILFTGTYPRGMWDFVKNFLQYNMRLNMYMSVLTVGYPPFSLSDTSYGMHLDIPYPEKSSRLWLFLAWIAVLPVAIVNLFILLAAGILNIIASFVVLFTGSMSQSWYEFIRKAYQQRLRVQAFTMWLHPQYPPFGLDD